MLLQELRTEMNCNERYWVEDSDLLTEAERIKRLERQGVLEHRDGHGTVNKLLRRNYQRGDWLKFESKEEFGAFARFMIDEWGLQAWNIKSKSLKRALAHCNYSCHTIVFYLEDLLDIRIGSRWK